MKEEVLKIISDNREWYNSQPHRMIADYNREKETTEGYNGRQLLELLQNCDDEGAKKVLISIDKENQVLKISNTGNPFSVKGYRSILVSNLSPKSDKKKYIGNKGLGFRSIINWAEQIRIHSNDLLLTFSEKAVQNEYKNMFPGRTGFEFNKEYGLKHYEIPIPILSLPKVEEKKNDSEYTTTVEVNYKNEFYEDIKNQVKQLRPEILLFLHHIEEIQFLGFDNRKDIKCVKESLEHADDSGPSEVVRINNNKWYVFKREGELEQDNSTKADDSNFYQLKLAISENLENDYKYLFSFFPTQVRLDVPYLIHGTFDLDQNRNQLNNTKRNKKVLSKLVGFIVDVAKYYAEQELSWKPLSLLNFKRKEDNASLKNLGFNKAINKALREEKLWPCVSRTYMARDECIYVNDEFSKFIQYKNPTNRFGNLLIPSKTFYIDGFFKKSMISNVEEAIDEVSGSISEGDVRAELIYLVNQYFPDNKFSVLTNTEGEIIDKEDDIYTPSSNDITIPSFCRIHFINEDLYNLLIKRFGLEKTKSKQRALVGKLNSNCSILSYEPQNLISKIISSAKSILESDKSELSEKEIVVEMVQSLYRMYQSMTEPSEIRYERIPLINSQGDVKLSKELYLGNGFETGRKASLLFKKIRTEQEILASTSDFGFLDEPIEELEQFFVWLGVNEFVRYEEIKEKYPKSDDEWAYARHVLRDTGNEYTKITSLTYTKVYGIDVMLNELSIEVLISWLHIDKRAKEIITDHNYYKRYIKYYYRTNKTVHYIKSYLQFKFYEAGYNFNTHLVESRYNWINDIKIDFNHSVFEQLDIATYEVESILKSLGGKSSFNDLSIHRVKEVINLLPEKFPDGKNSQTIYKSAVGHYRQNGEKIGTGYKLFAKTKNSLEVLNPESIYYSDKVKLPSKLMDAFPILNFPSRGGGQLAIEFFGVNDLSDIEINIESFSLNDQLNKSFQNYYESLKPYILLYRIDEVQSKTAREQLLRSIKSVKIMICNELTYEANGSEYTADLYEYVPGKDNCYYIKCNKEDTLKDLQNDSAFSDSFASIFSDLFDISREKSNYRALFRNGLDDAVYVSQQKFGEELIQESKLLLGLGNNYDHFWGIIYQILDKKFDSKTNVLEELGIKTDLRNLNYEDLNSEESLSVVIPLFQELEINFAAFNSIASIKVSLSEYHRNKFESVTFGISKRFRIALWLNLMSSDRDHKIELLDKWAEFENDQFIAEVAKKNEEKINVDYESYLDQLVKKYGLTLTELKNLDVTSDPENAYTKNKKEFSSEELSKIESNIRYKSLLYFENELEYLKEVVSPEETDKSESKHVENGEEGKEQQQMGASTSVIKGKRLAPGRPKGAKNNGSGPYVPSNNGNTNKQIGDKCEEKAYDQLLEKYGMEFVDKVSNRDEGMHYDIRYSSDGGKTWRFVEVKNLAKGKFTLTRSEKEFGEENGKNYELHLVDLSEDKIYVFNNPYNSSEIDIIEKDYWVYYQIID